jgi:hypothetical protein
MAVAGWPWDDIDWNSLLDGAVTWLAGKALGSLNDLWDLLKSTALSTPDVTTLEQVKQVNSSSMIVVNAAYVLVFLTAGILVMTKDTLQIRYGISELAPRLVFGYVAATLAPFVTSQLITLSNALTEALTGEPVSSAQSFQRLQDVVRDAVTNPADALLALIITLIICGLTAALMVNWLVRIGVVVALAGVAPLALACHALPQTEGVARLWWKAMAASLGTVTLQAMALHVALSIFLNSDVNKQALGLGTGTSSVLNLFIVMCLLWVVVKIPSIMRRLATNGSSRNLGGDLVRLVAVRQLTRGRGRPASVQGRTRRAAARRVEDAGTGEPITTPGGGRGAGASGGGPRPQSRVSADAEPKRRSSTSTGRATTTGRPARPWPTQSDKRPPRHR